MATITPPDFLQMAQDLADRTGQSETAVLVTIGDLLRRKIAESDNEQHRWHLGQDLLKVEAGLDAAMTRDIRRPVKRGRRR